MAVSLCQLIKSKVKIIKDAKSQCKIGVDSTQPTEFSPSSWRRGQDSESKSKKVKSDSLKCSRLLTSLSPSLLPRLYHSLPPLLLSHCLFLESPVGNVNRDFTAQCRCISQAHISPTCDLHQRRGSWGIFHASREMGVVTVMVVEGK